MLHKCPDVILPQTLYLLEQIQADPFFDDFFLVGETALALHIGHRLSIDLDFFTLTGFDTNLIEAYLNRKYGFATDYVTANTLKGFMKEVKTDFITHAYPLVNPLLTEDGLRLASLQDIGAMKLNAIAHSGNRQKDFFDLYFILEHCPLLALLNAYETKYPNSNPIIPLKAITWFHDIDFVLEKPMLKQKVGFEDVKSRLMAATISPDRVFNSR
ncbi:MAG TPA: nucleotidyl transferase AbiEii/AbiGii toxin family protein [Chitinophagales bacterium]|nr:nucleotidyl transferase AbiEii/AbiGii toxin family protein [Chitinophagales bacterium]